MASSHAHVGVHRRRGPRFLALATALAVPLTFFGATAGSAAPTLTISEAQAQLTALQAKADTAVEAFNAGRIAHQKAARQATAAQARVAAEQKKLKVVQDKAAKFAAAAYTMGGTDSVVGLLNGQSPASVLDRAANLNQIARSRHAELVSLDAQRTALAGLQRTAADRAADAAAQQKKLDDVQRLVQSLVAAQQNVLNRLQATQRRALEAHQAAQQAAALRASRSATRLAPISSATAPAASGIAGTVLAAAYAQRGKAYVYGAAGPNTFDCSGLIMWAFAKAGVSLPHSAAGQYGYGTHVPRSQLQPGDIVFFAEGGGIGHDGIYVGNGLMIDANHTGGWVDVRPLYSGFVGGTRL